MSGDNYKFQTSFKYGPGGTGMMNVRGETLEEFQANLQAALATLGDTAVLVDAYNTEFQGVAGPPSSGAPQPGGQSSGELCKHGAMVHREGRNAKGPWSGWFCPTQKDDPDKCPPKFDRK